jgi:hypothetical protein
MHFTFKESPPWTVYNTYNWNNQPTTVTTNQVLVPQSVSAFQDEVIDVTALVKDMQANGNNGFFMRLQMKLLITAGNIYRVLIRMQQSVQN